MYTIGYFVLGGVEGNGKGCNLKEKQFFQYNFLATCIICCMTLIAKDIHKGCTFQTYIVSVKMCNIHITVT
jgi:hypothetical protein